jgi:hypothetical protein
MKKIQKKTRLHIYIENKYVQKTWNFISQFEIHWNG